MNRKELRRTPVIGLMKKFENSFFSFHNRVPTVNVNGHRVYNLDQDDPLLVRYPDEAYHEYQEEQFGKYGEGTGAPLAGDLPIDLSYPELLRYGVDVQHSGTNAKRD